MKGQLLKTLNDILTWSVPFPEPAWSHASSYLGLEQWTDSFRSAGIHKQWMSYEDLRLLRWWLIMCWNITTYNLVSGSQHLGRKTLKMEAVWSFEALATTYQATQHHNSRITLWTDVLLGYVLICTWAREVRTKASSGELSSYRGGDEGRGERLSVSAQSASRPVSSQAVSECSARWTVCSAVSCVSRFTHGGDTSPNNRWEVNKRNVIFICSAL
jgi:hypothetical protein